MLKQGLALANLRQTPRQRRNFMKNLKNKNYKPIAVFILITLLFFVFRIIAQAEEASSVKTILEVGVIGFLILNIATRILTFAAGLVDFAVRFGNDVLNLPAVQSGWGIVLNITNLGFVLAIIIIAFATILRFENYAMKKTLWKLIVAALLVNFSLVIAGSIMSISNIASNVFYDAALGNGGKNLSNALANAMNPQRYGEIKSMASLAAKYFSDLFSLSGNINYVISLIFIIIFTFLTILAFVSLFVMLFMRAIILAFLLIVSPIIWLLWIFPSTQEHWKKWWSEFIRWNFFAPAVYFFIYLAVLTAAGIQDKTLKSITDATQSGSAAMVFNTGGFMSNIFTHAANLFVVLGLLYGGIYVANKFGIAGGGIGVKWAEKIGGSVGSWSGRKGKAFGSFPFRSEWGQKKIEKIQKYGADKGFFGKTFSAPIRKLGTAFSGLGVGTGGKLVSDAGERLKNRFSNDKDLANAFESLGRDEKIAAAQRFSKNGTAGLIDANSLKRFIGDKKTEEMFKRHNVGKDYGDFEKSAGINREMATAKSDKEKEEAAKKFYKSYDPAEFGKINKNILFDDKKYADADIYLKAMIETNAGALGKLFPKLNSNDLDAVNNKIAKAILPKFEEISDDILGAGYKRQDTIAKLYAKDIKTLTMVIKKYTEKMKPDFYKAYSKHLASRLLGFTPFEKEEKEVS